jgi:hypothetical protein
MSTHDIVPVHLVVKAMRDSGYRNAAYAIAELMDNAIQAGATDVELLCGERTEFLRQRQRTRVHEIAVLDNGCGMDADVLRMALQFGNGTRLDDYSGIGRFGMGLPNSSISQARRVEVWSWQNGRDNALYTYLDIDEIANQNLRQIPEPKPKAIPKIWREVGKAFGKTGTLVVWSSLDRVMWRTAKSIIDHSEFLVGRMYRYFLKDGLVKIRLVHFDMEAMIRAVEESFAKPNDPLYLTSGTSCPPPYNDNPMFEQWGDEPTTFVVKFRDEEHKVTIRFAFAKEDAREGHNPGARDYGQHAKKNVGVSVVRANRELDLDPSWSDPSEPRDRWWGVEINFPPALDDLFGVTNNKQSARNFSELAKVDLESLLEDGQSLGSLREELEADEDPRMPLLEIARHIRQNIATIRRLIKAQTASQGPKRHETPTSEQKGTEATRKRQEEGHVGQSDFQESEPVEQRQSEITESLIEQGVPQKQAEEFAALTVGRGLKYKLIQTSTNSPAFFDVQPRGGTIIIALNVNHPAYAHLVELLQDDLDSINGDELRSRLLRAREGLELLLMAWARHEDEQSGIRRDRAQQARWDWGTMAREFLTDED